MIIHASKAFEKRFKCAVSGSGQVVLQAGRLDAWSGHVVRIGYSSYVALMNDATLYCHIIPAKGLTRFPVLLKVILPLISDVWAKHGRTFDPDNQSVIVLPRTNRALIGSMNDAMRILRYYHEDAKDAGSELDLGRVMGSLNMMPYKALGFDSPGERMRKLPADPG